MVEKKCVELELGPRENGWCTYRMSTGIGMGLFMDNWLGFQVDEGKLMEFNDTLYSSYI